MGEVNHETRKHALLSASGASRWLNCTPSARLEERFDESSSSSYAEEGTLAHEFADITLRWIMNGVNGREGMDTKVFKAEKKKLEKHKLFYPEMINEVDKYVGLVMEAYKVAQAKTPAAVLLVEERLDFSHIVEKGYGTSDATIIGDGILHINDLKFGKGIKVEAEENSQMKLYGIGALRRFDMVYDIHTVRLTIIQPRLDHISSWDISVEDLIAWGEEVVKPKAAEAYKGEGVQCAGDWCRFCKVKPMCKTLAEKNMSLAKHEFADPHLLTEEALIGIFKQQPMLVDWANAVSQYLLDEAIKGKTWPGYKLVEGRSIRKWEDETSVIQMLENNGLKEDQIFKKSLKPITDLEKSLTKEFFAKVLSNQIIKPPGKPTLVPNEDKRHALGGLEAAKRDFADGSEDLM